MNLQKFQNGTLYDQQNTVSFTVCCQTKTLKFAT